MNDETNATVGVSSTKTLIEAALASAKQDATATRGTETGRHYALVVTKLEEALLWNGARFGK